MDARSIKRLRVESLEERRLLTTFSATLLKDFSPGEASTDFSDIQTVGDHLYFDANGELWRTDGTSDGTEPAAEVPPDTTGSANDPGDTNKPGTPPDETLAAQLVEQRASEDGLGFGRIIVSDNFGDQVFLIEDIVGTVALFGAISTKA